ncbi:TonB-dependent receptor [Mucilaginibacter lacusdianchii]|uniref:TonB-dependent receptor n=1 Tax=Mucilaginibacter lacusdianchii TaxID=2684211 RepID=UPI00131DC915|nr:TonB-dependent receptor [Mucilaginibacter sp. JXJ CY 39]
MRNLYKITFHLSVLLLLFTSVCFAQKNSGKITGKVLSSDGKPVAGVTVVLQEIKKTTVSQENGRYVFNNVTPGTFTVIITHVGAKAEQQTVTVVAGQTTESTFTLTESASELKDVVIKQAKSLNRKPVNIGKIDASPLDLPQSIVTIGQDVIEEQQAVRLSDVVKNANGVYLSSSRGSTQETFAARGYNFSNTNMFKNGFRVNSGTMPEVSSLEKVEILKGNAALLYGNVAPGGILNMVTKKPKFEQGGSVSMTAGSYNFYKPVFDVYGPLSSKLAYRVNGTYENSKSYRDIVKNERFYINPSLLYKASDRTTILLEGDYLNYDFTPDFGTGQVNSDVFTGAPRNRYYGPLWTAGAGKAKQVTGTATINHELNNDWKLSGGLSFQRYERGYTATERLQPTSTGDFNLPLNRTKTSENYYTGQVNLSGKFTTGALKHNVLLGVDADRYNNINYSYSGNVLLVDNSGNPLRDANGNQRSLANQYIDGNFALQSTTYATSNIFNPNTSLPTTKPVLNAINRTETPTNRFGAYINDLISISEKFKLMAGVRWSYQYVSPVQTTTYANATPIVTGNTTTYRVNYNADGTTAYAVNGKADAAFSPRVGIVYKPLTNTSLFASYSNSFIVNSGIDVNGNSLDPSTVDQYEAGVKNDFFNGTLSVNATVFRIRNNNLAQTAQFLADGVTPNSNTNLKSLNGQTTSDGAELDVAGHPIQGLDILAGYSYNFARYTKTPSTAGSILEGDPLLNTPKHTANASVFYTFSSTALKGFKFGASAFYLGNRNAGFNNVRPVSGLQPANRLVPVKGFTTVDLSAGYTYKKVSIIGKVSNVGDVLNYNVHENYSVNPIPPRQFIATATYRF